MHYEEVGLWARTLGGEGEAVTRLRTAYMGFRRHVKQLAAEIHRDLPEFTVHDISHIDALWQCADLVVGPDYSVNPLEAFVLGGAFLIHDLAMGSAAWVGGVASLEGSSEWQREAALVWRRANPGKPPPRERNEYPESLRTIVLRNLLRQLHASKAETLLLQAWCDPVSKQDIWLLEDSDLRNHLGKLIGKIAHSHWFSPDDLLERGLGTPMNAPVGLPPNWVIDPLKVACMLRCADAAHVDERRAPRLLFAARALQGESAGHWGFQARMHQPRLDQDEVVYTSADFSADAASDWWLCWDTLSMVNRELIAVDQLLRRLSKDQFAARRVRGADSTSSLAKYIPTDGWTPTDARLCVRDIAGLVRQLGGAALYGDQLQVMLRELIQNGIDAVLARNAIEPPGASERSVRVRLESGADGWVCAIEDDGVGMTASTLTGPLLSFGESYWFSLRCNEEHPKLGLSTFVPAGRFGIGFFSSFMPGGPVRVASKSIKDPEITHVLDFPTGLADRAILRSPRDAEHREAPGTTIYIHLPKDVPPTRLVCNHAVPNDREGNLESDIGATISYIAPASPVTLHVLVDGSASTPVLANDWKTLEPARLVERISGEPPGSLRYLERMLGTFFAEIQRDGETIVRGCVAPPIWLDTPPRGTLVQQGLRLCNMGALLGIAAGLPTVAARSAGVPDVEPAEVVAWLEKQSAVEFPPNVEGISEANWLLWTAQYIYEQLGTPGRLPIALAGTLCLRTGEVAEWAKSRRKIYVAEALGVDPGLSFADRDPPNLLRATAYPLGARRQRGFTPPVPSGEAGDEHAAGWRRALAALVLREIATAWDQAPFDAPKRRTDWPLIELEGPYHGYPIRGLTLIRGRTGTHS